MKTTINKYILHEIWPALLATLLVFIFIVLAARMLTILEWIVNHGVSPFQVLSMIGCLLPGMILFALPATTLMAVFMAFLRLSGDNEIQALKTSGMSLYQMLPPAVLVSLVAFLLASVISFFGAPWGNRTFRDMAFQIAYSKADLGIKERIFSHPFNGITFYVNSFSPKEKAMSDIFLVDRRDPSMTSTIVAKEGTIVAHPESKMIILHFESGTIFNTDKNMETARTIRFNAYDLGIDTNDLMPSASSRGRDQNEMGIQELWESLKTRPKGNSNYNEMVIELMERFTIPLAVFLMGIIGVPLGAQIRSGGRRIGIILSLLIFLIYYLFFVGMRSMGETGMVSPFVGPWLPDGFLFFSSLFLLKRAATERPINLLNRIFSVQEY